MGKAGFNLNINLDKITKTIGNVDKFKVAVIRGIELGIDELQGRLKDKLIENMVAYGLGNSPLLGKVRVDNIGGKGIRITVDSEYAMYIEFGTGIVGAENPHPHPWIYDVNAHGEKGWFYPTTENDPNPYKHFFNGVLYAWTKGQKSRPFMYQTWLWGSRSATQIIRKNINKEVKSVRG